MHFILSEQLSKPLISPRQGDGKIFGFNIFGISSSRAPRGAFSTWEGGREGTVAYSLKNLA